MLFLGLAVIFGFLSLLSQNLGLIWAERIFFAGTVLFFGAYWAEGVVNLIQLEFELEILARLEELEYERRRYPRRPTRREQNQG